MSRTDKSVVRICFFRTAGCYSTGRGKGLRPLPHTPSSPRPSRLRFAPDRFLLTKPNTSCTIEMPASLRSDGVRDHPGMPFGFPPERAFSFTGIPTIRPRVINVDGHPAYPRVIKELKRTGELGRQCRCRPSRYMNNIIEQDHRFVKKRVVASQWFRSVAGAQNTIAGYEAMNMIRKGQIRWLDKNNIVGQATFVGRALGIAA